MHSILSDFKKQTLIEEHMKELNTEEICLDKEKCLELPIDIFNKALELQLKKDGKGIEILDLKKCHHCGRKFQAFCICPESDIDFQKTIDEVREVSERNNSEKIQDFQHENLSKEELLKLPIEKFNSVLINQLKKYGFEYKIPELKTCECGRKYGIVCICKQIGGYIHQKIKDDFIFDTSDDNGLKSDEKFFDNFSFHEDEMSKRFKSELHSPKEINEFKQKYLLKSQDVKLFMNECSHLDFDKIEKLLKLNDVDLDFNSQRILNENKSNSGRTTRLIDYYIQEIFTTPNVEIKIEDHFVSHNIVIQTSANNHLFRKILKRMNSEHMNVSNKIGYTSNPDENEFLICWEK